MALTSIYTFLTVRANGTESFRGSTRRYAHALLGANITVAEVELIWEMAQLYEVARTICCTSQ